jgi:hypothetical protein
VRRRYEVTEMYALIEIAIWSSRAIIFGTHLPSRWGCRSSASRMHTIQPPNLSFNPDAPRRRASPPPFVAPVNLVR